MRALQTLFTGPTNRKRGNPIPILARALCTTLLFAGLFVSAVPELGAQTPKPVGADEVNLQTVIGFSNRFRLGRWAPVTVIVENHGPDLVGQLEVTTTGGAAFFGGTYSTTHRRNLVLADGSRKRFRFTVLLESFSHPLAVRVLANGQVVASQALELRHRFTERSLVLALSRDADLDYLNSAKDGGLRVVYPHPELLPDRMQAYDGVSAVILHGVSLQRLSPRQYQALVRWLADGGVLAVSGGPGYAVLRTPRLDALLPATPSGLAHVDAGAQFNIETVAPLHAPQGFTVHQLTSLRGDVSVRAGDIPLVVSRAHGKGRVVYLSFDVGRAPFSNWNGMERLWARALALPPTVDEPLLVGEVSNDNPVFAYLQSRQAQFPGLGIVLVFLTLYLGALATGYRLVKTGMRGTLAHVGMFWIGPVFFAGAAFHVFGVLLFSQGATAVAFSVIEPLPDRQHARLDLDLGLFSTRQRLANITYSGAEPALRPVFGTRGDGQTSSWIFAAGSPSLARPERAQAYVVNVLEGYDVVPFDWAASVTRTATGVRVRLRNDAGIASSDAWIVLPEGVFELGPIADGADFTQVIGADTQPLANADSDWRSSLADVMFPDGSAPWPTQAVLIGKLQAFQSGEYPAPGEALVIARTESPLRLVVSKPRVRPRAAGILVARVPIGGRPRVGQGPVGGGGMR